MKNNNIEVTMVSTIIVEFESVTANDVINIINLNLISNGENGLIVNIMTEDSSITIAPMITQSLIDYLSNNDKIKIAFSYSTTTTNKHLFELGCIGSLKEKIKSIYGYIIPNQEFIISCANFVNMTTFSIKNLVISSDQDDLAVGMFENCYSLEKIGWFDTSNITTMDDMFNGCISLKTIPKFNTSNVTSMMGTFTNCSSLEVIPEFDTSKLRNAYAAFLGCTSLKEIPLLNLNRLQNGAGMFMNCLSLKNTPSLILNDLKFAKYMFANCESITTPIDVSIPICYDASFMFSNCDDLNEIESLNVPNAFNVTGMFAACTNLKIVPHEISFECNLEGVELLFKNCFQLKDKPKIYVQGKLITDDKLIY